MKELLKGLVRLAVMAIIVMVAFFGFMAIVALSLQAGDFLRPWIGDIGVMLLYTIVYAFIFVIIYEVSRNQK
jgi:hypothetical protein